MEDIWETHKESIWRLYIIEDKTCQQVAAEMKARYGFEAKAGQYHRHFEKWKFRKSLSEGEWKFIGRRIQKRKAEQNKESELRINGFVMHQKKVEKALSRYPETSFERAQRHATLRRSCTPEGIVIATPPRHEPLTPLCFPVYVENLPFLRFQQILVKEASVFDQLLLSFRRLHLNEGYSQDDSIILNTPTSSQSSSSAPLSALLDMVWDSSRLIDAHPTVSPSFLKKVMTILLELANNSCRFRQIKTHLAETVFRILQFKESKERTLKLIEENSPVIETLVELLFKYALSKCNIELIEFLLQHSHIGPNDILRCEETWGVYPTGRHHMGFGEAITPIEHAIINRSSTLLRSLRKYGAIFDVRGKRAINILNKIPEWIFDEVIFFMLEEGLMDTIDATEILGEKYDTILHRRIFGMPDQNDSAQDPPGEVPPMKEPPTKGPPAEESPPEGLSAEELSAEELLKFSIRNNNVNLSESLLEKGTKISEETFLCAIQCGNLHVVNKALEAGTNVNTISAPGTLPLKIAAERGDLSIVQSLLNHGAEVEPATSCSPIFWSIPSHEIVKLLLKRGVNLHVLDDDGVSPLCHFLLRRDLDTAMFLIDWGVCLGRHPKRTPLWVPTPLQIAATRGYDVVVEKLLDRNVDVNEDPPLHASDASNRPDFQNFCGDTALAGVIRTSWGCRTRIIDRLISKGANPNIVARYGDTPLSIAIDHGDEAAFQSLVKAGAYLADPEAFRAAAASGDLDFLHKSLENGLCIDEIGTCALSNAVYSKKLYPGIQMRIVSSLIHLGARTSDMRLVSYFVEEKPDISRLLLTHGAYPAEFSTLVRYQNALLHENISEVTTTLRILHSMPSSKGEFLKTSFFHKEFISAARSGSADMTKAHIDAGINVESLRTDTKMKATYDNRIAAVTNKLLTQVQPSFDWFPCARLCDPPQKEHVPQTSSNGLRTTDLQILESFDPPEPPDQSSRAVSLLKRNHGKGFLARPIFHLGLRDTSSAEIIKLEVLDPDQYYLRKTTSECLREAAIMGGPTIIELLHEAGLDVSGEVSGCLNENHLIESRRTALQYAIQQEKYASADALIQSGADVNAPVIGDLGLTALQAAAIHGHIGIACKLLEKGAEVNAPGGSFGGRTALEGAAEWGRLDMVQLLLDNGADITDSTFGEAQYRNSTKFANNEGYLAIARLIKRHRLSMGYSDLSCDNSV